MSTWVKFNKSYDACKEKQHHKMKHADYFCCFNLSVFP